MSIFQIIYLFINFYLTCQVDLCGSIFTFGTCGSMCLVYYIKSVYFASEALRIFNAGNGAFVSKWEEGSNVRQ